MLVEARRVLKPGEPLAIGFVDRTSELGRYYLIHQAENVFYREARFYSASEVGKLLRNAGFLEQTWGQTLLKPLNKVVEVESFCEGVGNGGFVVSSATAPSGQTLRAAANQLKKQC